jgi:hypothetical protein
MPQISVLLQQQQTTKKYEKTTIYPFSLHLPQHNIFTINGKKVMIR